MHDKCIQTHWKGATELFKETAARYSRHLTAARVRRGWGMLLWRTQLVRQLVGFKQYTTCRYLNEALNEWRDVLVYVCVHWSLTSKENMRKNKRNTIMACITTREWVGKIKMTKKWNGVIQRKPNKSSWKQFMLALLLLNLIDFGKLHFYSVMKKIL